MEPEVVAVKDYDGYFEQLVRSWVARKKASGKAFHHTKIEVSAGPWRSAAVSYASEGEGKKITFDFYSALRTGFGQLSDQDVEDIIELL